MVGYLGDKQAVSVAEMGVMNDNNVYVDESQASSRFLWLKPRNYESYVKNRDTSFDTNQRWPFMSGPHCGSWVTNLDNNGLETTAPRPLFSCNQG